jgi:hypothetical protein
MINEDLLAIEMLGDAHVKVSPSHASIMLTLMTHADHECNLHAHAH